MMIFVFGSSDKQSCLRALYDCTSPFCSVVSETIADGFDPVSTATSRWFVSLTSQNFEKRNTSFVSRCLSS